MAVVTNDRVPLCELKIDQSFVNGSLRDANDESIVRAIIALGYGLDLQVIAEGVETAVQALRLVELGCTLSRGYYFGRPQLPQYWHERLCLGELSC
ncbi:MAG: EAL domain-containing protein [Porticoccaceae bacterium]|nr:EAL domain-containing protein [Porticoccaceae bacterium]